MDFERFRVFSGTGKLTRNLAAPHQVTTWNADAACIHETDGLGVSPSNEIKTFQAFFADVALPYSVKRLEVLPIVVSAYNYLPQCMPVSVQKVRKEPLGCASGSSESESD